MFGFRLPVILIGALLIALGSLGTALADWNNLSQFEAIAELRIDEGPLRLHLRLKQSLYERLMQGRTDQESESIPRWLGRRLVRVQDGASKELTAMDGVVGALSDIAASRQPQAEGYTLELEYPRPGRMSRLRILPVEPLAEARVGLVVLHKGVPVSDLAALSKPLVLTLHWGDPWRSSFDDLDLVRRHAEPRSYLYVEPYEVRHEVLIRLADLHSSIDLGLRNTQRVEVGERAEVQQKIGAFLLQHNPLIIDGKELKPQLDRIDFVGFSRTGIQTVAGDAPIEATGALVGAVIVYFTEQPARQLNLRWEWFEQGHASRAVSVIQGNESFDGYMTRQQPVFEWSHEETLQSTSTGGALPVKPLQAADDVASPDQSQWKSVVQALLHNAYRAFALRAEEAVYDRLAKTLTDPLLEDIYLQQRRAMLQQAKGLGGEGRVERIEVLEARRVDGSQNARAGQTSLEVRWKAQGNVSHWGHSHPRDNLYAARLRLQRVPPSGWKIAGMHFIDGERSEIAAHP